MKVLVLSDVHLPFGDWGCITAAYDFARKFDPDKIVITGDLTDQYAWSRFGKDPDGPSANTEWDMLETDMRRFQKLFSKWPVHVIEGNHCRRIIYRAVDAGLPSRLIPRMQEIFPCKNWYWHLLPDPLIIDNVMYIHGDEATGGGTAIQKATLAGRPLVQGHTHLAEVTYRAVFDKILFAVVSGCMIDQEAIAMRYARRNIGRCILGWSTIIDGVHANFHAYRGQHGKK